MEQRQRDAASNPNFKKPNDMIQWLMVGASTPCESLAPETWLQMDA
jgi:hypothetical protein